MKAKEDDYTGAWWKRSVQSRTALCVFGVFFFFFLKDDDGVDVQNQYLILCEVREEG